MSKNRGVASAIGLLAGLFVGKKQSDVLRKRQDKLDKREDERHTAAMSEIDDAKLMRKRQAAADAARTIAATLAGPDRTKALVASSKFLTGEAMPGPTDTPAWNYKPADGSTPPATIGGLPTSLPARVSLDGLSQGVTVEDYAKQQQQESLRTGAGLSDLEFRRKTYPGAGNFNYQAAVESLLAKSPNAYVESPAFQYKPADGSVPPPTIGGLPTALPAAKVQVPNLGTVPASSLGPSYLELAQEHAKELEQMRIVASQEKDRIKREASQRIADSKLEMQKYKGLGDYLSKARDDYQTAGGDPARWEDFARKQTALWEEIASGISGTGVKAPAASPAGPKYALEQISEAPTEAPQTQVLRAAVEAAMQGRRPANAVAGPISGATGEPSGGVVPAGASEFFPGGYNSTRKVEQVDRRLAQGDRRLTQGDERLRQGAAGLEIRRKGQELQALNVGSLILTRKARVENESRRISQAAQGGDESGSKTNSMVVGIYRRRADNARKDFKAAITEVVKNEDTGHLWRGFDPKNPATFPKDPSLRAEAERIAALADKVDVAEAQLEDSVNAVSGGKVERIDGGAGPAASSAGPRTLSINEGAVRGTFTFKSEESLRKAFESAGFPADEARAKAAKHWKRAK